MENEQKVRIAWVVVETDHRGFGEPIDLAVAEAWIDFLDAEYGKTMRHWIVPATDNATVEAGE